MLLGRRYFKIIPAGRAASTKAIALRPEAGVIVPPPISQHISQPGASAGEVKIPTPWGPLVYKGPGAWAVALASVAIITTIGLVAVSSGRRSA